MATTLTAQPQTESTTANKTIAWAQAHRRTLMIAGGVLIAVIVVAWFLATAKSRREDFAARSLTQARNIAETGNIPAASAEFQKIIDTYGGTSAAAEAVIGMNQLRLIGGQSELAVVSLREFVGTNPEQRYAAAAHGLLGAALENVNRAGEAAESYKRAAELAPVDYLKAEYLLQAGRSYRIAGKGEEAQAAYRSVIENYPETGSVVEARVRLAELTGGQI